MNFVLATAVSYVAFTKLVTTNGNLSVKLRQQEDHIRVLRSELCNLKVAAATRPVDVKTNMKGKPYSRDKKQKPQWPIYKTEKSITTGFTVGRMVTTQATRTRHKHAQ